MTDAMTRLEHLNWCKERAREYLAVGDYEQAVNSMLSDLGKHPETAQTLKLAGPLGIFALMKGTVEAAREFVEGFN